MTQTYVAISKSGVNVLTDTNPNNKIFDTRYNTLKIIGSNIVDIVVPAGATAQEFSVPHNKEQIPFCEAFMREGTIEKVIPPNNGYISALNFEGVKVSYTDLIFILSNNSGSPVTAHIKYYLFEIPL